MKSNHGQLSKSVSRKKGQNNQSGYRCKNKWTRNQRKKHKCVLLNSKELLTEKFYYTYYKGWCEDGQHLLFPTATSAMLWQIYLVFKDGYAHVFPEQLPLVFATVGVIELSRTEVDGLTHDKCLRKCSGIISEMSSRTSMVATTFFQNLVWFSITNDVFFSFIHKQYLKRISNSHYKELQTYFSKPDYQVSSNSIFTRKIELPLSKYSIDCTLYDIHSGTSVPRSTGSNGLTVCYAYQIKRSLKEISADNNHGTCIFSN